MKWSWKKKQKEEPYEELFKLLREMCKVGREYCAEINKMSEKLKKDRSKIK